MERQQELAGHQLTTLTTLPSAPITAPSHWMVLFHGAGADIRHAHMQALADALAAAGIATVRVNFPYMERGGGRVDSKATCVEVIAAACAAVTDETGEVPLLGGHSFGGRMASHAAASIADLARALVFFSFPLHVAGKPAIDRAAHVADITRPMLFLSGTRDGMARHDLMEGVVDNLPAASLHWLHTADHGFKTLKRTRPPEDDVYEEITRTVADWLERALRG